jgi:hypothetical protein
LVESRKIAMLCECSYDPLKLGRRRALGYWLH